MSEPCPGPGPTRQCRMAEWFLTLTSSANSAISGAGGVALCVLTGVPVAGMPPQHHTHCSLGDVCGCFRVIRTVGRGEAVLCMCACVCRPEFKVGGLTALHSMFYYWLLWRGRHVPQPSGIFFHCGSADGMQVTTHLQQGLPPAEPACLLFHFKCIFMCIGVSLYVSFAYICASGICSSHRSQKTMELCELPT